MISPRAGVHRRDKVSSAKILIHPEPPATQVSEAAEHLGKLFSYEGYGFIETEEGEELYFHRNSVLKHGRERMSRC